MSLWHKKPVIRNLQSQDEMACCDQLLILIWMHWTIEKRNPFKPGSEISLPLMVSLVLLLINNYYTIKLQEDVIFKPYKTGIGIRNFSNRTELIYCPTNGELDKLIHKTTAMLGISKVNSFKDEETMAAYVQDEVVQERMFAAVQFHSITGDDTGQLPRRLNVSLRFPEFHIRRDLTQHG